MADILMADTKTRSENRSLLLFYYSVTPIIICSLVALMITVLSDAKPFHKVLLSWLLNLNAGVVAHEVAWLVGTRIFRWKVKPTFIGLWKPNTAGFILTYLLIVALYWNNLAGYDFIKLALQVFVVCIFVHSLSLLSGFYQNILKEILCDDEENRAVTNQEAAKKIEESVPKAVQEKVAAPIVKEEPPTPTPPVEEKVVSPVEEAPTPVSTVEKVEVPEPTIKDVEPPTPTVETVSPEAEAIPMEESPELVVEEKTATPDLATEQESPAPVLEKEEPTTAVVEPAESDNMTDEQVVKEEAAPIEQEVPAEQEVPVEEKVIPSVIKETVQPMEEKAAAPETKVAKEQKPSQVKAPEKAKPKAKRGPKPKIAEEEPLDSLVFKKNGRIERIKFETISHITVEDHYCTVTYAKGARWEKWTSYGKLKNYQDQCSSVLVRINRSTLVNPNMVVELKKEKSKHFVKMKGDQSKAFPLSPSQKHLVDELIPVVL